jgi:predicted methyltransferase
MKIRHALFAAAALVAVPRGRARRQGRPRQYRVERQGAPAAISGDWRTDKDKARDVYRHPAEALTFWGLKPGMTVLEVQPGGGWWTEILAPYARLTGGHYYSTASDLANPELSDRSRKSRTEWEARPGAKPDRYGKVGYVNWGRSRRRCPPTHSTSS